MSPAWLRTLGCRGGGVGTVGRKKESPHLHCTRTRHGTVPERWLVGSGWGSWSRSQSSERKSWLLARSEGVALDHREMNSLTVWNDMPWKWIVSERRREGKRKIRNHRRKEPKSTPQPKMEKRQRTGAVQDASVSSSGLGDNRWMGEHCLFARVEIGRCAGQQSTYCGAKKSQISSCAFWVRGYKPNLLREFSER